MTPNRSALGSPSKASELDFIISKNWKSTDGQTGQEYIYIYIYDIQSHMLRPTIADMQDKYCSDCYDVYLIQRQYTKVAAFGRQHKGGGAAFARATSFVVSFVLALNRVNIVAVTTILVLLVGVIGHHVPRY